MAKNKEETKSPKTVREFAEYLHKNSGKTYKEIVEMLISAENARISSNSYVENRQEDDPRKGEVPEAIKMITHSVMDLGWAFALESPNSPQDALEGMVIGTPEYIDKIFQYHPKSKKNED